MGSWENYRKIATLSFSCSQWCVCMCVLGNTVDLWFAYMKKLFEISNLKGTHSLFNSIDMSMQCILGRKLNVMCVVSSWLKHSSSNRSEESMLKLNAIISIGCTCIIYAGFTFQVKEHVNDSIYSWKLFSWIHFEMQWLCSSKSIIPHSFHHLKCMYVCVCDRSFGRAVDSMR